MEGISWLKTGAKYRIIDAGAKSTHTLDKGVYSVSLSQEGFYLTNIADEFVFSYKVYALQTHFVDHVLKTFNNTNGNLGILLNGIKGTGKTVTAKVLANKLGLPVIVVKSMGNMNPSLIEFLSQINCDCILFLDEFEKGWDERDCSILQIMDGAYNNDYRRVFLLTTNTRSINENLISRPSRIRYVKEFGNLEESVVREYLDDTLNDKSVMDDVVSFVDTLSISTIDILKTIVEDINIHGFESFMENRDLFNVKTSVFNYTCDMVAADSEDVNFVNYGIKEFKKDMKWLAINKKPSTYDYSQSEFDEAMLKWRQKAPVILRYVAQYRSVSSSKSLENLKIGDRFGYWCSEDEVIVEIDAKAGIVITYSMANERRFYYYVTNANSKPSLYSSNEELTNAYKKIRSGAHVDEWKSEMNSIEGDM